MAEPTSRYIPNPTPCGRTRREFLWQVGGGFAGPGADRPAVARRLLRRRRAARRAPTDRRRTCSRPSRRTSRPRRSTCVFLFMNGAPSQVDTFDPKPALDEVRRHSRTRARRQGRLERPADRPPDAVARSRFTKHGQSGLEISSLFPHTARFADDLCVHPLDVHRHGGPRLGLPADEHRQRRSSASRAWARG